ncbi:gsp-2 [Symbiodinium natans]|uniref:Gsp-2 protein n=1 Tax=Symbiodinium natans TaxID=878477 RepID=A0A812M5D3_9DINO|nr:gsp-2 [Symbiodinium natans]
MSKAFAAGFGAVVVQLFSGLAPGRASWGWTVTWTLTVPEEGDFTCQEGSTGSTFTGTKGFSGDADFTCTVVPNSDKTCDVNRIRMRCSDASGVPQGFLPTAGNCVQDGHAGRNVTPDALSWSQRPVCTPVEPAESTAASRMAPFATAAFLAGLNL